MWSRYYDPAVGRYLNHDVVFDYNVGFRGYNLFAYCGNTPIFRLDPFGTTSVGAEENADPTDDTISEKDGQSRGGATSGTDGGPAGIGNSNTSKTFSEDQRALLSLAKENRQGVSLEDANTLVNWANEYGISNHPPMIHEKQSGIWSYTEHIKIKNIHIPVIR